MDAPLNCCIEIPAQTTAGLSFQAAAAASNHPAPVWTATLHFRGPSQIDLTAAPDGTGFLFTAAAAETADWQPGAYWWAIRATDGNQVVEIERGDMIVNPDLVQAGAGYDGRSQNEIALEAIEAVLAKRATLDQSRYRINNRELYRESITELRRLRQHYKSAVRRERLRARGVSAWGRNIPVRFS